MRKILFSFYIIFVLIVFSGCSKNKNPIVDINIDENIIPEYVFDEFEINDFKFNVTYKNGNTDEVLLNESMLCEEDLLKLTKVGTHEITICYGEIEEKILINIISSISSYKVYYYLEDFNGEYQLDSEEVFNDKTFSKPEITKTFNGYSLERFDNVEVSPDNQTIINAYYRRNKYTLSIYYEDSLYQEYQFKYGDEVDIEDPYIEDMIFTGFDSELPTNMPSYNININAIFKDIYYTCRFVNYDNTVLSEFLVKKGSLISYSLVPTKEKTQEFSYMFVGWKGYTDGMVAEDNYVFVAEYKEIRNLYRITFVNYDDCVIHEYLSHYGEIVEFNKENPTKPSDEMYSYNFTGWDKEFSETTDNIVYKAVYEQVRNYFFVTTKVGNITNQYKVMNGDIPVIPEPIKVGYTFVGWNKDITVLTDDIVVEPIFEINKYKLTYTINGEFYKEIEYKYNEEIDIIDIPELDGKKFKEWQNLIAYMPAMDYTINARYYIISDILSVEDLTKEYDGIRVYDPEIEKTGDGRVAFEYYKDGVKLKSKPVDAGEYVLRVHLETTENYYGIYEDFNFIIYKRKAEIIIDNKTSIYGEKQAQLTYKTSRFLYEPDVELKKDSGSSVGTYNISTLYTDDNYDITIINGVYEIIPTTIKVQIMDLQSIYNESILALDYKIIDGIIYNDDDLSIVLTKEAGLNAGEYSITGTCNNSNYDVEFIDGIYTINKAESVINASDYVSVYNGNNHLINPVLNHNETTLEISHNEVINAGKYIIIITAEETDNYLSAIKKVTYTIDKAETIISVSDYKAAYNGQKHTITGLINHNESTIIYSDNDFINSGTYEIQLSVLESMNYKAASKKVVVQINKANSYISAEDIEVTYDGNVHYVSGELNHNEVELQYSNNSQINAGEYDVLITAPESVNYLSSNIIVKLIINKAETVIEASDINVVYDGKEHSIIAAINHNESNISYIGNNQVNAGKYEVTIEVPESNNYLSKIEVYEINIQKADAIITAGIYEYTYDGMEKEVEASLNHNETALIYKNGLQTNAGQYEVEIIASETKNYNSASVKVLLVINKAKSVVNILSDEYTYDGSNHGIIAELNHNEVEIKYSKEDFVNAGTYEVEITVEDSLNYYGITLTHKLIINKAKAIISASNQTVQYDELPHSIDGVLNHNETTLEYSGRDYVNIGTYSIVISSKETQNYLSGKINVTLTIYTGDYDYSGITFYNATYVYDGTIKNIYIEGSLPTGMTVEYVGNGQVNAGTYEISAVFTDSTGNYKNITPLKATLKIEKADAIITASDKEVTYDKNGHSIIGNLNHNETTLKYSQEKLVDSGKYEIIISSDETTNYNSASVKVILTINKAETLVNVISNEYTYDENPHGVLVEINHDESAINYLNNSFVNAGTYVVTITVNESTNYLSYKGTINLIINKANTIIDITDKEVVYNKEIHSLTATINHSESSIVYTNNGKVNAGVYEVVVSVAESKNYKAATVTGILSILKADSIITLTSEKDFIYNTMKQGISCSLNHNEVSLSYTNNENVTAGTYTVTVTASESYNYNSASETFVYNIRYLVKFYNYDSTLLYQTQVLPNEKVEYLGVTPTREETTLFKYEFKSWDTDLSVVNNNLNVYPIFNEIEIKFNVVFNDSLGNEYKVFTDIEKGTTLFVEDYPVKSSLDKDNAYKFVKWSDINYDNPLIIDSKLYIYVTPEYDLVPASCKIDTNYFAFIEDAINSSNANDVIEVIKNDDASYDVYSDITIPSEVTLYIPYADGIELDNACGDIVNGSQSNNNLYLTINLYSTMNIYGSLVIGGQTGNIDQAVQGAVNGYFSEIIMHNDSKINVGSFDGNNIGLINCSGYIVDNSDSLSKAQLNVYTGSKVTAPFVLTDWLGGTFALNNYSKVSVFNRFQMPCINVESNYYNGSLLKGIGKIYAGGQMNVTDFRVFGYEEGNGMYYGLIYLTSDNPEDKIVMNYSSNSRFVSSTDYSDNCEIKVYGDCTDNYAQLKVSYQGATATASTRRVHFPLHYGIDLSIMSGTFVCQYRYKVMPGAKVTVAEDATIDLQKSYICIFDSYEYPDSPCNYPVKAELEDAGKSSTGQFIINGKLVCSISSRCYLGGNVTGTGTLELTKYVSLYDTMMARIITDDTTTAYDKQISLSFNGNKITTYGTYTG